MSGQSLSVSGVAGETVKLPLNSSHHPTPHQANAVAR